ALSLDHAGVFARSVVDLQLMLDVLTESPLRPSRKTNSDVRIGIIRGFFYENATPEMCALTDALANKLSAGGFSVGEARLPEIFEIHQSILRMILRSEAASLHERLFAEHSGTFGPKLRALIETGMLVDAVDYARAKRLQRRYQREMAKMFE